MSNDDKIDALGYTRRLYNNKSGKMKSYDIECMKKKKNVKGLVEALKDEDANIREATAKTLGEIGESAVEPLMQVLKDKDREIRIYAVKAFGWMGDLGIEPLIQAMKDKDWKVQLEAQNALFLRQFQPGFDPEGFYLLDLEDGSKLYYLNTIWGKQPPERIFKDLEDENPRVQDLAWALIKLAEPGVEQFIEALKENDEYERLKSINSLVTIGEPAVESLIKVLKYNEKDVRERAAWALGRIGDVRALNPLIEALKDEDLHVRWHAAEALGEINNVRAIEPLTGLLEDKNVPSNWETNLTVGDKAKEAIKKIKSTQEEKEMAASTLEEKNRRLQKLIKEIGDRKRF